MPTPVDEGRRLPALLLTMAVLTGLVDSVSFLGLGQVFVANMTGNVVFLAFALAGAPGLSADLSALALAGFLTGAALAGRIGGALAVHGRPWLLVALSVQAVLIAGALTAAQLTGGVGPHRPYAVIVPLALAMGLQHATARRVARPEIPTNVLTTALTGLVVDSRLGGGRGGTHPHRVVAPLAMFAGAGVGGFCLLHLDPALPLMFATAIAVSCLLAVGLGLVAPADPKTPDAPDADPHAAHT